MKKRSLFVVAVALLAVLLAVPASAHGGCGGGGHRGRQTAQGSHQHTWYSACTVEDCAQAGLHEHAGVTYRRSGTEYPVCPVEGCAEAGLHQHDGATYHCAVAGCAQYWS